MTTKKLPESKTSPRQKEKSAVDCAVQIIGIIDGFPPDEQNLILQAVIKDRKTARKVEFDLAKANYDYHINAGELFHKILASNE